MKECQTRSELSGSFHLQPQTSEKTTDCPRILGGRNIWHAGSGGADKMAKRDDADGRLAEIRDVLLETYAVNDAMNQLILGHLEAKAWRGKLPGMRGGRTIAAIFAHMHNCRLNWIRNSAPHLKCPAALEPDKCTMKQTAAALQKSATQCSHMMTDALAGGEQRRVKKYSRGSWSQDWPAGGAMFAYMFGHEAHHRGQIMMLAHQLGYRLPVEGAYGIWHWEKLWKRQGFSTRPR
jgi:uncharacterized damage-inducible protein DinB